MEIKINYTVNKKEFLIHRFKKQLRKPFFIVLGIILLLSLISFILDYIIPSDEYPARIISYIYIILIPILYNGLLFYNYNKAYNNSVALKDGISLILNESGYHSKTNTTSSSLQWLNIKKVKLYNNFIDFHFNKKNVSDVPRRFIEDYKLLELKEILEKNQVKNNL